MLGVGYLAIYNAYNKGPGSMAMIWLCFFSFLTGSGGCAAFLGSIKTSALNWPDHRGTATAFPLAAFGLSAFFFSAISTIAFPDNTSTFLLVLAIGTFCMIFISSFFLLVVPHGPSYSALTSEQDRQQPLGNPLHRMQPTNVPDSESSYSDETSSLVSHQHDGAEDDTKNVDSLAHDSHHLDIRGLAMLPRLDFWLLWTLLGLLTGVGLMTINNLGNDAQALWNHYDPNASSEWVQRRQLMHVSILSIFSFLGRLLSGIGSDVVVKKLHMSRFWCIIISSLVFCAAQVAGATVENPNSLVFVSGLTGLGYGFLFGVYPTLVAEAFGVHGLSQNWGCMTLAPVVAGNIFNLLYGTIYDSHSVVTSDGHRMCPDGLQCYSAAYWVTFGASLTGVLLSLWCIRHEHVKKIAARRKDPREES